MSVTIQEARKVFERTAGLNEVTFPYRGGSHEFRFESDGTNSEVFLDLGGHEYRVDRDALTTALKRIPGTTEVMADRWPLRFLMEPLNFFFDHKEGDGRAIVLGDDIVSFTKPSALMFRPVEAFDAIVDAMEEGKGKKEKLIVHHIEHGINETRFSIASEGRFVDARPGDRTLGGLSFRGSLAGLIPLEVDAFTQRVVCSNGMISPDGQSRFRLGHLDGESADGPLDVLREWLHATSRELFAGEALEREMQRLTHLTHQPIQGHSNDVLSDFFTRFSIPSNLRTGILESLGEEADGTMYGIVQSFTRAAQHHPDLSSRARDALMRHAGSVSASAAHLCGECRRPTSIF